MSETDYQIEEKTVEPILIAGLRMRGQYQDCGKAFGQIGKNFGFKINGKAMMLCYDEEYKADDADFEPCMPVRGGESKNGIDVRELAGGRCLSLLHKGPYETLSSSYEKLLDYGNENNIEFAKPSREVYIKGPGMFFKGNPKKYLTEIQLMIREPSK